MKRKEQFERNIAEIWHDGGFTDKGAELSTKNQRLSWPSVTVYRSQLYEIEQCANEGYYHGQV